MDGRYQSDTESFHPTDCFSPKESEILSFSCRQQRVMSIAVRKSANAVAKMEPPARLHGELSMKWTASHRKFGDIEIELCERSVQDALRGNIFPANTVASSVAVESDDRIYLTRIEMANHGFQSLPAVYAGLKRERVVNAWRPFLLLEYS